MDRFEDWLFEPRPGLPGRIARLPFLIMSALYFLIVKARAFLYRKNIFRSFKPAVPVVSVGNITLGGSGKTPLVIWLAQALQEKGIKPAISIRGYRSAAEKVLAVVEEKNKERVTPEMVGDEACLIAGKTKNLPVLVGKNRVRAAAQAAELPAQVLILDDGFQHLKLKRDLDIVLVEGRRPLFAERLFPRGRLREPLSALKRAQIIVISRPDEQSEKRISEIKAINPSAPIFKMRYRVQCPEALAGKRAFAFAGIADPADFFETVLSCKIELKGQRAFSDHHNYSCYELKQIDQAAENSAAEIILTTEKDLARLKTFESKTPVLALEIKPEFFGQEKEMIDLVVNKIRGAEQ